MKLMFTILQILFQLLLHIDADAQSLQAVDMVNNRPSSHMLEATHSYRENCIISKHMIIVRDANCT